MEKETRQRLERLTQQARRLLEQEFREQLEGRYDILLDGRIPLAPGAHLSAHERVLWDKLVAAVAHKRSQGITAAAAVAAYLREAAFHTLNRFVALKMLEARKLVQECISRGEDSAGFKEFIALAPGLVALPDKGYRLYVETIFDEIAQEVRALFDRRDAATLLWPRRQALLDLLAALNDPEVAAVWGEDETIGWVYQYFNGEDERRQMRAESQAPRNSRELAVRNQFFTPRYVVQFLTDNSLGRTWCEMRGADTQLAHLDYLVKPEEGFEERAPKDPRDLRVLDPACGSGHFLLYAFDLLAGDPTRSFFGIYEEAWRAGAAAKSEVTGRTLKEDYDSELALRRAVPELILKHNLHGVDIDPRAAQIAGLALWMRAQRAYNDHKVAAQDRPLIGRTNIVTAEPMPGDRSMVAEFASTLRPQVLGELFQRMVEEMRLAGELGSLLKIDRALQSAVAKAREQFLREQREPQKFLPGLDRPRNPQLEFDLSGVSDESFFDSAEERIVEALQQYAAGAPVSMSVRRQLFADDAAQGIAFIDLCRKRFDVVLMNPPFGSPSKAMIPLHGKTYTGIKHDVSTAFVDRAQDWTATGGLIGVLMTRTPYFLTYLTAWRESFVERTGSVLFADLGQGVLDALVETCAVCSPGQRSHSNFWDLRRETEKSMRLLQDISTNKGCFFATLASFAAVERSPFLYWVSDQVRAAFSKGHRVRSGQRNGYIGALTQDDFRFTRLWWEHPESDGSYVPFSKGGTFQPFYAEYPIRLRWSRDAAELKSFLSDYRASKGFSPHWTAQLNGYDKYFRPGISWSSRPHRLGSFWGLPEGSVFGNTGPAILDQDERSLLIDLAILNSSSYLSLLDLLMPRGTEGDGQTLKYELGYVAAVPFPELHPNEETILVDEVRAIGELLTRCATVDESSPRFLAASLLDRVSGKGGLCSLGVERANAESEFRERFSRIDDVVSAAYSRTASLTADDLAGLERSVRERRLESRHFAFKERTPSEDAALLLSALIGIAFGRFAMETGPRQSGSVFAALPRFVSAPGADLLADDLGAHASDLVHAVVEAARAVWGRSADLLLSECVVSLGHSDLRSWIANSFFNTHLAAYTTAKRSAPIYWQLATASGSYSVWLYIHRATGDTLFRVLNDFVGPKLDHEKAKLDGLSQDADANPSAAQRREIEQQETFVGELQALKTEVARVAPLWKPNLDDGVILNFAPLWRLVPQSRSWQGECKKAWDKLVAGDYDWAHLAMHLWPERVVPKCIDDRSLAIAHGLEEVFWHEDDSGTWRKSRVDDATVQKLIQERTSTTVKAALKDLLSAAAPTASKGRKARGRSASPRTSAPKPAPAAARATTPDTVLDEATLRAVKAAIASVADGASKADVLAATGLSDGDWNKAIAALLDRGDVTRTGQKRGTRYHADSPGEDG